MSDEVKFSFIKKIKLSDPVKSCELYKTEGCSHVDGLLCDFPECSMNKNFIKNNSNDTSEKIN